MDEFLGTLEPLMDAAYKNKPHIKQLLAELVTTYQVQDGSSS